MSITARRAHLLRVGISQGQAYVSAALAGNHVFALAIVLTFRAAWGADTLPRRAFDRILSDWYSRG